MPQIPLFPLKNVLFPLGRMPLQIFEQRYLNMVKRSMKENNGFGIVAIRHGMEVGPSVVIYEVGVLAEIIDWNQLSNGLLGITVVGVKPFRVLHTERQADELLMGEVEYFPVEEKLVVPQELTHLKALLQNLLEHSVVQKLEMTCDFDNASDVSWLLSYLLPFEPAIKVELLSIQSPIERLEKIVKNLDSMTEQLNK